jgi:OOP family OmpA-OmpF porin
LFIEGFRDPLARDPRELIADSDVDAGRVETRWLPFAAMDDDFALKRAQAMLDPPEGVTLAVEKGVLAVSGRAAHRWIRRLERSATSVPGIDTYRRDRLTDIDMDALRALKRDLEAWALYFNSGRADPEGGQEEIVDAVADLIGQIQALQDRMGIVARVAVIGHADPVGSPDANFTLSVQRASKVHRMLVMRGIDPLRLSPMGNPMGAEENSDGRGALELFRKVTFKLRVARDQVEIDG